MHLVTLLQFANSIRSGGALLRRAGSGGAGTMGGEAAGGVSLPGAPGTAGAERIRAPLRSPRKGRSRWVNSSYGWGWVGVCSAPDVPASSMSVSDGDIHSRSFVRAGQPVGARYSGPNRSSAWRSTVISSITGGLGPRVIPSWACMALWLSVCMVSLYYGSV